MRLELVGRVSMEGGREAEPRLRRNDQNRIHNKIFSPPHTHIRATRCATSPLNGGNHNHALPSPPPRPCSTTTSFYMTT